jgi:hypothetical protein
MKSVTLYGARPALQVPPGEWRAGRRGAGLCSGRLVAGLAAAALTLASSLSGVRLARAADNPSNSCGCYQDASGACFCGKKAKCGCPGSCEPKGCEEKRAKQINKEIEAETRKAEEAGRRYAHAGGEKRPATAGKPVERETSREQTPKVVRMTDAQRRELARLLDLYTSEHRDHGNKTLNQIRGELTTP